MLHVPLIINGPGLKPRRFDKQVQSIDVAPTVMDMLGKSSDPAFLGKSLLMDDPESTYVISEVAPDYLNHSGSNKIVTVDFNSRKTSIRMKTNGKHWKYIFSTKNNMEELYDLAHDPSECNDLISAEQEETGKVLKDLKSRLSRHFETEDEHRKIKESLKTAKRTMKKLK